MRSTKLALARETVRTLRTTTHLRAGMLGHVAFDSKRWIGHTVIACPDPSDSTTAPPVTAPRTAK